MLNTEWWMFTLLHSHILTLSHSHTLILLHSHTHTHIFSRNQIVPHPNRELCIVTPQKTRKTQPFTTPITNSAFLHQNRHDWTVSYANIALCIVISKGTRLNRSPSQTVNSVLLYQKRHEEPLPNRKRQDWTVPNPNREHCHCYIEKDWTEPCPIPTANSALLYRKIQEKPLPLRTESSAVIYRKRQNWIVAQSEQRTLHCYIEKDKTEPFLLPNRELCFIMSTKKWRTVAHSNVGFCIVISKQARLNRFPIRIEKSALVYENGKTDPFFLPTDNFALLQ